MVFGFINGPIKEKVMLQKDDIAEACFDCEIFVVVFLGVGENIGQFSNMRGCWTAIASSDAFAIILGLLKVELG